MGFVITLIILGIILLLAEIFLIPGIGIAGILGLISLCGSSYYAFAFLSPMAGAIVTTVNIVLLAVVLFYALRAKTWKNVCSARWHHCLPLAWSGSYASTTPASWKRRSIAWRISCGLSCRCAACRVPPRERRAALPETNL